MALASWAESPMKMLKLSPALVKRGRVSTTLKAKSTQLIDENSNMYLGDRVCVWQVGTT